MDLTEAKKALDKAKIQLMARNNTTFITTICFSLIHKFDEKISTACTNGKTIWYNPTWFMELKAEEQLGLMLHETWHVAFDHLNEIFRKHELDPKKLNIAQDYVINNMLDTHGFRLPEGGYIDHAYDGMSSLQIYNVLPEPPEDFESDLLPSANGEEADAMKDKLDDMLVKASIQAQMSGDDPGSIPGEIQVYIDSLVNPKLPWDRILIKYFNTMVKSDYTFRKPNKRFMPDHILPSAYSEALGEVAFAVDMSGSVTDAETKQFISDAYSVLKRVKPKKLSLVQFDTRVFQVNDVRTPAELMRIDFKGRGGTFIEPVMHWGKENKPDVLVVFTDGYFSPPQTNPDIPVIWIIHNNATWTAPFGKVVHYTI